MSEPQGFYTDRSGRSRPFFAVDVQIKDGGGEYLQRLAGQFPAEFNKALRGAGAEMRQRILTAIEQGGPRTNRWEPLSGLFRGSQQGKPRLKRSYRPRKHYGRMRKAIAYHHDRRQFMVRIGWASKSAEKIYSQSIAPGSKTRVTPKLRRFYFASGRGLAEGTREISIPPRPVIGPMWEQESRAIVELIEQRVLRYVRRSHRPSQSLSGFLSWLK